MKRIPIFPTMVTLGNAFCGLLAIDQVIKGMLGLERTQPAFHLLGAVVGVQAVADPFAYHIGMAGWFIFLAMVFDALDGKVARMSHSASDFGAELDSLCDLVSFGVAPALIVWSVSREQTFLPRVGLTAGILYVMCAALRLARFNVETDASEESHMYFKGLPSPAAAGFIAALTVMYSEVREEAGATHVFAFIVRACQPVMDSLLYVIPYVAVLLALLMVSRIRYVHLINRYLRGQEAFDYLAGMVVIAIFAWLIRPFSLPIILGIYILSGIINAIKTQVFSKMPGKPRDETPTENSA